MMRRTLLWLAILATAGRALAQDPTVITIDAGKSLGPLKAIWPYFGYDEANYTYGKDGEKLISDLTHLGRLPVYFRTHNLLTTGDGTPALKWGSTNAYTEDANGKPVYDWTIVDRIVDAYIRVGAKPFVEIGFMPEALSVQPEPYRHDWPRTRIKAGWAYPPRDYSKWGELVYQWVRHSVQKYGASEVNVWYWEVWNEPDIEYWQGTPEEYDQLYDYAVDAVKRAAPGARVGGPATTGPASPKAAAFLTQFLAHCDHGKNYATGKTGAPLDFVTYHAKGAPQLVDGHVVMGIGKNLRDVSEGMKIVTSVDRFRNLPIILSESDPEGCAACSARNHPENAYRNGPLYASYTAAMLSNILKLAEERKANIEGMLTWAFEFENQPYFDGFRTLETNGIPKPVINIFAMWALLRGDRVDVQSSAGVDVDTMMERGVRAAPDINAVATRAERAISVVAWNYDDADVPAPDSPVTLHITGLPENVTSVQVTHDRIDQTHSNAYTAWKKMGSPQDPAADQKEELRNAGRLQTLSITRKAIGKSGEVDISFPLPRQAVSLVRLTW